MFKLMQKVMEKEKADGTFRGRRRELMARRFGKKEKMSGGKE
jgi:hypothetical protein